MIIGAHSIVYSTNPEGCWIVIACVSMLLLSCGKPPAAQPTAATPPAAPPPDVPVYLVIPHFTFKDVGGQPPGALDPWGSPPHLGVPGPNYDRWDMQEGNFRGGPSFESWERR